MAADGGVKRMTEESERRKREGVVTDEESVELWLVQEEGEEYTEWQRRGGKAPEMPPSSGGDGRVWVAVAVEGGVLNFECNYCRPPKSDY